MLQPQPPGYRKHEYQFQVALPFKKEHIWKWLNDTHTFTDTQVWPYKVEFYSPNPELLPEGFHEGVLTNHDGPFVNFAGKIMEILPDYRDLQYFYGSYAISFRWIRPYRLEFWTEGQGEDTLLTGKISSWVKPGIYSIWNRLQKLFWRSFKSWATKSIGKLVLSQAKTNV